MYYTALTKPYKEVFYKELGSLILYYHNLAIRTILKKILEHETSTI
jgi:hypothetical protein